MPKTKYLYCDSCVFLAYFNGETGRADVLEQLFDEVHNDKERKILTSAYSIIEVAHVADEKEKSRLKPGIEEEFDAFWGDTSLIEFIDFHENLARQARTLMRQATQKGFSLQGADALHLVSARMVGIEEFFTYDSKLFKYADMVGYKVIEPYVNQLRLL